MLGLRLFLILFLRAVSCYDLGSLPPSSPLLGLRKQCPSPSISSISNRRKDYTPRSPMRHLPLYVVRMSEANRVVRKEGKNFEYNAKKMHIPHKKRLALNDVLPRVQRPVMDMSERKDLSELKAGDRVKGRVVSIKPFGMYLDIGAVRDGLVHIKEVSNTYFVDDLTRRFQVGQDVDAWIKFVDEDMYKLCLQMYDPALVPAPSSSHTNEDTMPRRLDELVAGERVSGFVVKVSRFGVYVDVGAEYPAFLPKRYMNLAPRDRKLQPWEIHPIGSAINARIFEVQLDRKRFSITTYPKEIEDVMLPPRKADALRSLSLNVSDATMKRSNKGASGDSNPSGRTTYDADNYFCDDDGIELEDEDYDEAEHIISDDHFDEDELDDMSSKSKKRKSNVALGRGNSYRRASTADTTQEDYEEEDFYTTDSMKMSPRPVVEQEAMRRREEAENKNMWIVDGNLVEERYRAFDSAPMPPVEKIFWRLAGGKNYVGRKDMLKNPVLGKYFFAREWDKDYISACIDRAGGYMNRMNATAFKRFFDEITVDDSTFMPDPYGEDVIGYDALVQALFEDLKIMSTYQKRSITSNARDHLLFDDFATESSDRRHKAADTTDMFEDVHQHRTSSLM